MAGSPETLTYLHTDHLGTPKFGTDATGTQVWAWAPDAFGGGAPSGSVTVNLRMAGQYYDAESTLFYNWNRYYNPATGRYISSDPIGLDGGINTFLYAAASPVMYIDPEGTFFWTAPIGFVLGYTLYPQPANAPGPNDPIYPIDELGPLKAGLTASAIGAAIELFIKDTSPNEMQRLDRCDMKDTSTWPTPPTNGPFTEGSPSRNKGRERGEKSLFDPNGGEWRPHQTDKRHPIPHWDYKPKGNSQKWQNRDPLTGKKWPD